MKAEERRTAVLEYLCRQNQEPSSASELAQLFGVSRQIIVGDIALLRASGARISATPRGYVIAPEHFSDGMIKTIACRHTFDLTEKELNICVDYGCQVLDVIVEHPLYGQLTGKLELSNRYDVREFITKCQKERVHALSELTDGIHLHTLRCPSEAAYRRVCEAMKEAGILVS